MTTITVEQQDPTITSSDSGVLIVCGIMVVAIVILYIVAWWKIFEKAGLKGWKSLIPFYNQYCLFRISGLSGWWIFLPLVAGFCYSLGVTPSTEGTLTMYAAGGAIMYNINPAFFAIGSILAVAAGILEIVQVVKIASAFKKGIIFKIVSIFFPNITYLILAFGKAKYNKKYLHN